MFLIKILPLKYFIKYETKHTFLYPKTLFGVNYDTSWQVLWDAPFCSPLYDPGLDRTQIWELWVITK